VTSRRRLLLVAPLLLLFGVGANVDRLARKTYLKHYEAMTRKLVLYWDFETALILRGTYLAPDFRMQLAEERRRLLNVTDGDHDSFVAMMKSDADAYHEIVFSADSGMPEGQKFGNGDDGWQVRLFADGTQETLVTVFKEQRPNMMQRSLYPHFNKWSDLWIARFRRTVTDPDTIVFEVGGGYGHGELVWDGQRSR
jgi:hypothetical protein